MVDERYASITCQCGQKFQALVHVEQDDGFVVTDWDEAATSQAYHAHLTVCAGGVKT